MTKEEFEKKFKVGDEIQYYEYSHSITLKFIGHLGFYCESLAYGSDDFNFNDYDLSDFKKVEPVKKYWKHVVINAEGYVLSYVNGSNDRIFKDCEYLKEPTEITLDDI